MRATAKCVAARSTPPLRARRSSLRCTLRTQWARPRTPRTLTCGWSRWDGRQRCPSQIVSAAAKRQRPPPLRPLPRPLTRHRRRVRKRQPSPPLLAAVPRQLRPPLGVPPRRPPRELTQPRPPPLGAPRRPARHPPRELGALPRSRRGRRRAVRSSRKAPIGSSMRPCASGTSSFGRRARRLTNGSRAVRPSRPSDRRASAVAMAAAKVARRR